MIDPISYTIEKNLKGSERILIYLHRHAGAVALIAMNNHTLKKIFFRCFFDSILVSLLFCFSISSCFFASLFFCFFASLLLRFSASLLFSASLFFPVFLSSQTRINPEKHDINKSKTNLNKPQTTLKKRQTTLSKPQMQSELNPK